MEDMARKAIRERRLSLLWSVRRLARETGLSPAYISQIESGKRPMTARAAGLIAEALGVPAHDLLAMAGLLSWDDVNEAKVMARRALAVPGIVGEGPLSDPAATIEWLTDDYLMLLGLDPNGRGNPIGKNAHTAEWHLLDPSLPRSEVLRQLEEELSRARGTAPAAPRTPDAIEGWDELSDADRTFVQQMVNKLRRAASED